MGKIGLPLGMCGEGSRPVPVIVEEKELQSPLELHMQKSECIQNQKVSTIENALRKG